MASVAEAPAKIILVGEHFCVHGAPAVSMAITLHSRVIVRNRDEKGLRIFSPLLRVSGIYLDGDYKSEVGEEEGETLLEPLKLAVETALDYAGKPRLNLDVEANSEIPIAVGLGSSASISVATIVAVAEHLGTPLTRDETYRLTYNPERYLHANPSGIDQTTVIHGGLILFRSDKSFRHLGAAKPLHFVVGNTGVKRSTGSVVRRVGDLAKEKPELMQETLKSAGNIATEAVRAVEEGNLKRLGSMMNENQELLSQVKVSHKRLDLLIDAARGGGALGAKLTGGGGGGCMIALTEPNQLKTVAKAIKEAGGEVYTVTMDRRGVHSWRET